MGHGSCFLTRRATLAEFLQPDSAAVPVARPASNHFMSAAAAAAAAILSFEAAPSLKPLYRLVTENRAGDQWNFGRSFEALQLGLTTVPSLSCQAQVEFASS